MNKHNLTSITAVLQGCQKQQRASQKLLYEQYYGYGMSIALRYTRNEQDSVEVLNDCFLKVFKNIKRFDLEKPFKPWFRRILINTALNHIKKNERLKMEESIDKGREIVSAEDVMTKINHEDLMRLVQNLSVAYKAVFNLYVIDGYKHEEIANMLNISVGTSKSNLFKAKNKLKEQIANLLGYARTT